MTETIADRYRRRAAAFTDTVAAVPHDRWGAPSPCDDWDARGVVAHVTSTQGIFEQLVGREMESGPSVDDDPLAAWTAARDQIQAHLDDPATAAVEFDGFLGRSSFATAVDRFLSSDLVVHRWDLAQAAGLDDGIDADDAVAMLDQVQEVLEDHPGFAAAFRGPGVCGPELTPPEGADPATRLLAFYGRRAW